MTRKALGKGLGALISKQAIASSKPDPAAGESIQTLPVHRIHPSPLQPRKHFDETKLAELADSIRARGLIEPLVVRPQGDTFELIAGERRWRAAQTVGLTELPVIVRHASDRELLELALIENLQRADLNPVEEAQAFAQLIANYNLTQDQLAQQLGRSRPAIANALRLLDLPQDALQLLARGQISAGHARALLALHLPSQIPSALATILKKSLTVRQTEALVHAWNQSQTSPKRRAGKSPTADWRDIELRLQRALGTKVKLIGGAERGRIEIQYFSGDDLDRFLEKLGVPLD
ncbi:MAG: ParB/RepB/Spo0J family partition protein [Verrucomicrobiia bacterium]